jgi:drug/metabolite transporter (DMT)-like permease
MNKLLTLLIFFILAGVLFSGIGELMNNICVQIRSLIPLVSVSLLVIAGMVYAIGKVLGQEFRSKSESWATTIAIGAILGLILAVSAPLIVETLIDAMGMEASEFTCEYIME